MRRLPRANGLLACALHDQLRGDRGGEASFRAFWSPPKDQPPGSGGGRPNGLLCGKRRVHGRVQRYLLTRRGEKKNPGARALFVGEMSGV